MLVSVSVLTVWINWIPSHLKFSNGPTIFLASTPKLASTLRLFTKTCPFLAVMCMACRNQRIKDIKH